MLTVYRTGAFSKIRNDHVRDPQVIDTDCRSGNIQDRIHGADFMKMNLIDRFAMNLGFRLRNNPEDPKSNRKCIWRQFA